MSDDDADVPLTEARLRYVGCGPIGEVYETDLIEALPESPRLKRIALNASVDDVARWRDAARVRGMPLTTFVREAARAVCVNKPETDPQDGERNMRDDRERSEAAEPSARELHEAWYRLATRAADALFMRVGEALERPRPPIEVTVRLHGPVVDAAVAATEPAAKKKRKPPARSKRR